jgi:hypothetical protein
MEIPNTFHKHLLIPVFCILFFMVAGPIVFSSCSKKSGDEILVSNPVFVVAYTTYTVSTVEYLALDCSCTTDGFFLQQVTIVDPALKQTIYYGEGKEYAKNEHFTFPEDFVKINGLWKFTFTGTRAGDHTVFSSLTSVSVK